MSSDPADATVHPITGCEHVGSHAGGCPYCRIGELEAENARLREAESFMRERAAMLVENYDGHGHELMPLKELAAAIRNLRAALEGRGYD